tara:strand:- start:2219 stop:2557 length:339 start_codon:yes stop_codon:yes gene_type:complete
VFITTVTKRASRDTYAHAGVKINALVVHQVLLHLLQHIQGKARGARGEVELAFGGRGGADHDGGARGAGRDGGAAGRDVAAGDAGAERHGVHVRESSHFDCVRRVVAEVSPL